MSAENEGRVTADGSPLLPCTCHNEDEPYCPRHTRLPGEADGSPADRGAVSAGPQFIAEGETLEALRQSLLVMMSDWSEGTYAAGWMSGTEKMLHDQGGVWEILGRAIGWPTGYAEVPSETEWVAWDEF